MADPIKTDVGEFLNSAVIWLVLLFIVIPAVVMAIIQANLESTQVPGPPPGQARIHITTPVDR